MNCIWYMCADCCSSLLAFKCLHGELCTIVGLKVGLSAINEELPGPQWVVSADICRCRQMLGPTAASHLPVRAFVATAAAKL